MKALKFGYSISVKVQFSVAELVAWREVALHHYDGKCKAMPAEGGTLYGFLNSMCFAVSEAKKTKGIISQDHLLKHWAEYADITDERYVEWSTLDTLAKTMEMSHYLPKDSPHIPACAELVMKVGPTLRMMRDEFQRLMADQEKRLKAWKTPKKMSLQKARLALGGKGASESETVDLAHVLLGSKRSDPWKTVKEAAFNKLASLDMQQYTEDHHLISAAYAIIKDRRTLKWTVKEEDMLSPQRAKAQ